MIIYKNLETNPILSKINKPDGYLDAWSKLIEFAETKAISNDVLGEYIVMCLLNDENIFTLKCENRQIVGKSLYDAVLHDITEIWTEILEFDYEALTKQNHLVYLNEYIPSQCKVNHFTEYQNSLYSLIKSKTPKALLNDMMKHIHNFGCGELAGYIAYGFNGQLYGIDNPHTITFNELIGLDVQKNALYKNTEAFLNNFPANNVLLSGDSGTGKSSCVKALLNKYYTKGLRLVEFPKEEMHLLSSLMKVLTKRNHKYIIFLDDLSFEDNDVNYKSLKAIIDGHIEKLPENILLYATSNRRHLIKESWKDRADFDTDIHSGDTMNEKLSLSERFGIRLNFSSISQDEYINMIEAKLKDKNIELTDEIKKQAVIWEMRYNGRSGRTAQQFVNNILQAE